MKLDSKYFDSIRVKPANDRRARSEHPPCQWKGCPGAGQHRAPKGRGREGQYFIFCAAHIKQYNQSYNYFDGMSDADVAEFQKDAMTGHRPTWKMGVNSNGKAAKDANESAYAEQLREKHAQQWSRSRTKADPHGIFGDGDGPGAKPVVDQRPLRTLERKSLDALNLQGRPTKAEVKARFKELVKRHHPDSNGGDKSSEERLREIIQAYNYLKQAGLV